MIGSKMRFGRKKKEEKLFQQWARYSDLPPEAIPQQEAPRDIPVREEKTKRRPHPLHILLGVGITVLCVGLALLFVPSC
jgi:hypothetical protein